MKVLNGPGVPEMACGNLRTAQKYQKPVRIISLDRTKFLLARPTDNRPIGGRFFIRGFLFADNRGGRGGGGPEVFGFRVAQGAIDWLLIGY